MQVVFFRTPGEQLSFVLQNLEGPAKREAKLHVQKDSNAEDIFRLLIATFSGTKLLIATFSGTKSLLK